MSLIQLPPEILTIVLLNEAIPPHERIRLRRVARNWQELIEGGLEKQKKLVIYGTRRHRPPAKDHLVIAEPKFRADFAPQLKRLIPSLTDLTIKTFSYASYQQMTALLESYQTTLTTVCLATSYFGGERVNRPFTAATQRLFYALNALPNLTDLKLIGHWVFTWRLLDKLRPTLARLEHFQLEYNRGERFESLNGPLFAGLSARCTHLQLPATIIYWPRCNLVNSLTHLFIDADDYNIHDHRYNPNGLSDAAVRCISQLAALRHLRVAFMHRSTLNTARLRQLLQLQLPTELELELLNMTYNPNELVAPFDTERPLVNVRQLKLGLVHYVGAGLGRVDEAIAQNFWTNVLAWFPRLERLGVQCRRGDYQIFNDVLVVLVTAGCVLNIETVAQ